MPPITRSRAIALQRANPVFSDIIHDGKQSSAPARLNHVCPPEIPLQQSCVIIWFRSLCNSFSRYVGLHPLASAISMISFALLLLFTPSPIAQQKMKCFAPYTESSQDCVPASIFAQSCVPASILAQNCVPTSIFAVMTFPDNLYGIFGLNKDANDSEIRSATLEAMKLWHPDKSHRYFDTLEWDTANEIFVTVKEARSILSDPHRRAQYDAKRLQVRPSHFKRQTREASGRQQRRDYWVLLFDAKAYVGKMWQRTYLYEAWREMRRPNNFLLNNHNWLRRQGKVILDFLRGN